VGECKGATTEKRIALTSGQKGHLHLLLFWMSGSNHSVPCEINVCAHTPALIREPHSKRIVTASRVLRLGIALFCGVLWVTLVQRGKVHDKLGINNDHNFWRSNMLHQAVLQEYQSMSPNNFESLVQLTPVS
jgi:hypothetical protein